MAALYIFNLCAFAEAASVVVNVVTVEGKPLADAVIYLESDKNITSDPSTIAVMDQHNKAFVPHVLAVPVGTTVDFPNTDTVNHYVYSFSDSKKFQFKLFKGDGEKHQLVFDKPGLVTMGCNIHDFMLGYIFVSPSPYVAVTNSKGQAAIAAPDKNTYQIKIWHERLNESAESLQQTIVLNASAATIEVHLTKPLKPERKMSHDTDSY